MRNDNSRQNCVKGRSLLIKLLLAVTLMIMILYTASQEIYGYTAVRGVVTVKSGKARKEPSTSAAFVFGVIKDESVIIIGEEKGKDGAIWYKVKVLNSVGYLRSDLVKKTNIEVKSESTNDAAATASNSNSDKNTSTDAPNASTASAGTNSPCVKGSNVIVREEASTKSGIRVVVQNGMALTVISTTKGEDGKDWCNVSFTLNGNNYKGFIRSDLVNLNGTPSAPSTSESTPSASESTSNTASQGSVQTGKIKGTGVNIRMAPVDGKVVAKLTVGDAITVRGQVKSYDEKVWYAISFVYNKKPMTGYVRSDLTEGIVMDASLSDNPDIKPASQQAPEEVKETEQQPQPTSESSAAIKGVGVRIRESAVSGNVIAHLDTGYPINIIEEVDGSDGHKWYKVSFSKNDTERQGYVRSDLVNITKTSYSQQLSDEEFEKMIADFPDTYKPSLRALHEKYPSWQFVPVKTGLEWSDVVTNESRVGKNLVSKGSIASWKSTAPQAYNWETNTWYGFDGGSWAAASPELIMYYLDPRNFLDDSGIFQFETLEFQEYQSVEGIKRILEGSFMAGDYTDSDGATRNYAQSFYEAGHASGVNPYHLAAKALQEQGTSGKSQSVIGNVSGLENLYNYFNIGAYAAAGRSATINGLYYAAGTEEAYYRPWNSRYKSIVGSSKYIGEKYIAVGQNTLYFQKFNVVNSKNGIYAHQYMSNVVAASYESARMKKGYPDINTKIVFRIPIYNNMPAGNCVKPTSDSNPNTYLSNLYVEGYNFTTPFSSVVNTYYLNVSADVTSVNVGAQAVCGSSSVGGTGVYTLNNGDNKIQVVCKAQNGQTKTYVIIVKRQ